MIRLALAAMLTSCVGAALLFSACGDSSFDAASSSDAQSDGSETQPDSPASDASQTADGDGVVPIADAGRILPIMCVDGGHKLCDTFDEDRVSDIWTVNAVCTQPFLDTANSVSAPSSLSTNDLAVGANCASVYSNIASPSSTNFSASFDVFVDSPSSTGFAPFFAIWVTTSDYTFYEIALTTDATGAVSLLENLTYLDAGPDYVVTKINAASLVRNAWNKVTFATDIASSNQVAITINDGAALSVLLKHRPSAGTVNAYRVYLGIPNGGDTKAAAHFDDFFCDVTP